MLIGDAPQTDRERALGQRVDLLRVNLERLQDELDRAIDLRVGLRKQLAREAAAKVEADLATQAVRAHAEDVAARLVAAICEQDRQVTYWRGETQVYRDGCEANAMAISVVAAERDAELARAIGQRDDARRRAEQAERVIEAYRGHPLRLEDRA